MKNDQQPVKQTGNVTKSRSKKMGLSSKNLASIMSILTNMYADSYEATLREYAANGFDSHVKAGVDRPVEVTLPTILSPSLLVQDYGVGMDQDTLVEVYAEYGESTKNDSDDEVGGFGIGAKSAFTLGSQFIVTAVKDGVKNVALFSMGEDGVPGIDIVGDNLPTDEPNGVLVSLAVEDVERMQEVALRVFSTWPEGSVTVDGAAPVSIFADSYDVNDSTTIVRSHQDGVYVTLGPVAYPVSKDQLRQVVKRLEGQPAEAVATALRDWDSPDCSSLFFRGGVGDMTIAPNREMLRDTAKTINGLTALVVALHDDLVTSVQTRVGAAQSLYQAAMVYQQARKDIAPLKVSRKAVTYNGQEFRKDVEVDLPNYILGSKGWTQRGGYSSVKVVQEHADVTLDASGAAKTLVVTGVKDNERGAVKRYVKRFLESQDALEDEETSAITRVMVTPATAASYGWFQFGVEGGAQTMTLDEWRAHLKTLRATVERTTNEPSYTTGVGARAERDLSERDLLSDILSWGNDLIVCHETAPGGPLAVEALADYTVVVLLATQSEPAFVKRVEADGSVEIAGDEAFARGLIKALAEEKYASVTDDERAALGAVSWLAEHRHGSLNTWANFYQHYSVKAEVDSDGDLIEHDADEVVPEPDNEITHPLFAEILEARALAEMVAADITDDRRKELDMLVRWVGKDVQSQSFDFEVPDFSDVFPLLNHIGWTAWRKPEFKAEALAYVNSKA